MIACHYSDGTTVVADSVEQCPAFRDDTGGQLVGHEEVYDEGYKITVDTHPMWWLILVAIFAWEKTRSK